MKKKYKYHQSNFSALNDLLPYWKSLDNNERGGPIYTEYNSPVDKIIFYI